MTDAEQFPGRPAPHVRSGGDPVQPCEATVSSLKSHTTASTASPPTATHVMTAASAVRDAAFPTA
jgi:hypothetical protein